ncbi:TetR family transcriptional regulator [Deinococcus sp. HMF7620]|uniref:TetR family transcriptional regulator n=1 Tax=Deinococcus arboris TaxID=2682977 RepID=A0A7C9HUC4_9DEIO|nr:TetR family transcriptional regulator [Deinococcus arboris]
MARTRRKDWLDAGLKVLSTQGEAGLTVDGLISYMGLTKGSFYHHFAGLPAYRAELLVHLEQMGFADVVDAIDHQLPPTEQLRLLTVAVSRLDPADDQAVRQWAERDPAARALVERMDERRTAYLADLFTQIVGCPDQGYLLARLGYALYLGAGQLQPRLQGEEYLQITELLHRHLLPAPGGEA